MITARHLVPDMTHPLSSGWNQPDREDIWVEDDKSVKMSAEVFSRLLEYSCTIPTGAYEGKMWRGYNEGDEQWWLLWYDVSDKPGMVSTQARKIIISED